MSKKKVYAYSETVERLASWGREFDDEESAERELSSTIDASGAALLALLKKLSAVGEALKLDDGEDDEDDDSQNRPDSAERLDGVELGQFWFEYDSDGIRKHVVTFIDDDGFPMLTEIGSQYSWRRRPNWYLGDECLFRTEREAMESWIDRVKQNIESSQQRIKIAEDELRKGRDA